MYCRFFNWIVISSVLSGCAAYSYFDATSPTPITEATAVKRLSDGNIQLPKPMTVVRPKEIYARSVLTQSFADILNNFESGLADVGQVSEAEPQTRGFAFGVSVSPHPYGWEVTGVDPTSAAAVSQIVTVGDIIYAGVKGVEYRHQLTQEMSQIEIDELLSGKSSQDLTLEVIPAGKTSHELELKLAKFLVSPRDVAGFWKAEGMDVVIHRGKQFVALYGKSEANENLIVYEASNLESATPDRKRLHKTTNLETGQSWAVVPFDEHEEIYASAWRYRKSLNDERFNGLPRDFIKAPDPAGNGKTVVSGKRPKRYQHGFRYTRMNWADYNPVDGLRSAYMGFLNESAGEDHPIGPVAVILGSVENGFPPEPDSMMMHHEMSYFLPVSTKSHMSWQQVNGLSKWVTTATWNTGEKRDKRSFDFRLADVSDDERWRMYRCETKHSKLTFQFSPDGDHTYDIDKKSLAKCEFFRGAIGAGNAVHPDDIVPLDFAAPVNGTPYVFTDEDIKYRGHFWAYRSHKINVGDTYTGTWLNPSIDNRWIFLHGPGELVVGNTWRYDGIWDRGVFTQGRSEVIGREAVAGRSVDLERAKTHFTSLEGVVSKPHKWPLRPAILGYVKQDQLSSNGRVEAFFVGDLRYDRDGKWGSTRKRFGRISLDQTAATAYGEFDYKQQPHGDWVALNEREHWTEYRQYHYGQPKHLWHRYHFDSEKGEQQARYDYYFSEKSKRDDVLRNRFPREWQSCSAVRLLAVTDVESGDDKFRKIGCLGDSGKQDFRPALRSENDNIIYFDLKEAGSDDGVRLGLRMIDESLQMFSWTNQAPVGIVDTPVVVSGLHYGGTLNFSGEMDVEGMPNGKGSTPKVISRRYTFPYDGDNVSHISNVELEYSEIERSPARVSDGEIVEGDAMNRVREADARNTSSLKQVRQLRAQKLAQDQAAWEEKLAEDRRQEAEEEARKRAYARQRRQEKAQRARDAKRRREAASRNYYQKTMRDAACGGGCNTYQQRQAIDRSIQKHQQDINRQKARNISSTPAPGKIPAAVIPAASNTQSSPPNVPTSKSKSLSIATKDNLVVTWALRSGVNGKQALQQIEAAEAAYREYAAFVTQARATGSVSYLRQAEQAYRAHEKAANQAKIYRDRLSPSSGTALGDVHDGTPRVKSSQPDDSEASQKHDQCPAGQVWDSCSKECLESSGRTSVSIC